MENTTVQSDDLTTTYELTEPSLPDQNTTDEPEHEEKAVVLPIYIYTAIFGAIFLLGPLLVRRGPNRGITRCCIMISAFCCWIFWVTIYIAQMNPLLGPRMSNTTLAWLGYKWGKNALDVRDVKEMVEATDELVDKGNVIKDALPEVVQFAEARVA